MLITTTLAPVGASYLTEKTSPQIKQKTDTRQLDIITFL